MCVRACMHARALMRMRVCMSACMCDVFAIYDNNISPRLIMIIIKIIILYFIQIRRFPLNGYPASDNNNNK